MTREELKEVIQRVIEKIQSDAEAACLFGDECPDCANEEPHVLYGVTPVE